MKMPRHGLNASITRKQGPQLLLQAFLQRIINGGGRINREYGLGKKRTDLFIEYRLMKNKAIMAKSNASCWSSKSYTNHWKLRSPNGLEQTAGYANQCGVDEAHLIIFDRRPEVDWDDKTW